ncbi:MAG: hypothetical protein Q8Q30_00870 [Candidatus Woesebacteria bacterium]|nr:hypothetical protein [Candidatus Woesebacteria bacterium]
MSETKQELTSQEKIDHILSAIKDPKERAEKEQLLKVFIQLGEGSNKAHKIGEKIQSTLEGK